jgi:hypothetical protein
MAARTRSPIVAGAIIQTDIYIRCKKVCYHMKVANLANYVTSTPREGAA